jgi:hypothetical protein
MIKKWDEWLFESESQKLSFYDFQLESLDYYMTIPSVVSAGLHDLFDDPEHRFEDLEDIDSYEDCEESYLKTYKMIAKEMKTVPRNLYVAFFKWPTYYEHGYMLIPSPDNDKKSPKFDKDRMVFWKFIIDETLTREVDCPLLNSFTLHKPNINTQLYFTQCGFPGYGIDPFTIIAKKETFQLLEMLSYLDLDRAKELLNGEFKKNIDVKKFIEKNKFQKAARTFGL